MCKNQVGTMKSTACALMILAGTAEAASVLSRVRATEACGDLTLCHTCEAHVNSDGNHDCVWCADKGGFCTPGSPETGPADDAVCSAESWTNGYCLKKDKCGAYSACHSCLADPFCGWCPNGGLGGRGVCVEGEAKSPLTGSCPTWEYGKCSEEPLAAANPDEGDVEQAAANAIGEIEGVAKEMSKDKSETEADEKKLASAEGKAFNVIKAIKNMIAGYKMRKEHQITATSHFTGEFEKKLAEIMAKRRASLDKVKTLLKEEYQEEVMEAGIVDLQMKREGEAEKDSDAMVNGFDSDKLKDGAEVDKVVKHLGREEEAMHHLEKFLNGLTSRDHVLMRDLKKHAHSNVENELHTGAMRKMAREEAAWYACSFLIQNAADEHPCPKFSVKYAGEQKHGREGELTPEENTRVCNQVQTKMASLEKSGLSKPKSGLSPDVYLSWCVAHVNVLCAKCHNAPQLTPDQAAEESAAVAATVARR